MEYLMTYGWAILIVIIVAAALWALGVFNPTNVAPTAKTGLSAFEIPTGGWQLTSAGALTIQLRNSAGAAINVTTVAATVGTTTCTLTSGASGNLPTNGLYTATFTGCGTRTSGAGYSANVTATYNNLDTGLSGFVSSGTLTGTVS